MNTPRNLTGGRAVCLLALVACLTVGPATRPAAGQGGSPVVVEPGDLSRRADLVGKEVSVDDRVRLFQFHPGEGYDELFLKRCPEITFSIPKNLREERPQAPAVKVRGVLRREGDRLRVDVTGLELLTADLDRLNRAVATLPRSDYETRTGWATWAETRARAFQDEALQKRAREVMGDAIRAEAERPPRDGDPAAYYLGLAERARQRQVPEPEPSALAHRGFRAALSAAKSAPELTALAGKVGAFFPRSSRPADPESAADLARWERPYQNDPAAAYRAATPAARVALDRKLWADVTRLRIERLALDDPGAALSLAEEAATLLPDRIELATTLLEKGLAAQSRDIAALKRDEIDTLARLYRQRLNQPDKARDLYRKWLDDQRTHRLSRQDAEGRLALAAQYEELLKDSATAVALLNEAWKIDPSSPEVADAFRRRGYRRVKDEWVASKPAPTKAEPAEEGRPKETAGNDRPDDDAQGRRRGGGSLLGATPDEVRGHFGGKPNRRSWCATQGQITEQWVYVEPRQSQYVTFVRKAGELHPRVVSYYSVPHGEAGAPR